MNSINNVKIFETYKEEKYGIYVVRDFFLDYSGWSRQIFSRTFSLRVLVQALVVFFWGKRTFNWWKMFTETKWKMLSKLRAYTLPKKFILCWKYKSDQRRKY